MKQLLARNIFKTNIKLTSREFTLEKLYIGPSPSILCSQCSNLQQDLLHLHFLSHLGIPHCLLTECTGMLIIVHVCNVNIISVSKCASYTLNSFV